MNCEWRATTRIFVVLVMVVCLIYKFDNAPADFRNFSVHGWPTIVLKLCDFQRIIYFAIRDVKFAASVVRTTFAVHVFYKYVVILDFIIRPVSRALSGSVSDLYINLSNQFNWKPKSKLRQYSLQKSLRGW